VIKYTLKCSNEHIFDGWFSNSGAFDEQKEMGLVACPSCGSSNIEKTLMAPSVTGTKMQGENSRTHEALTTRALPVPIEPELMSATIPEPLLHGDATMQAVIQKMRELRSWVEANTENVGDKFAERARKMHFGEEDRHGIIGKATFEEAQELLDDGVDFFPLPGLPEDNN